jgi:hypothetical protein
LTTDCGFSQKGCVAKTSIEKKNLWERSNLQSDSEDFVKEGDLF